MRKASFLSICSAGARASSGSAPQTAGRQISTHLARHQVRPGKQRPSPNVGFPLGDLLLNHACDQKMDLLCIGGYAQTRRGAFVLGPVAAHMTLPVLTCHPMPSRRATATDSYR